MRSTRFVLLVLVILVTLASCFDISMELELNDDGSAVIDATYDIPRDVWDRGVFDADNPNRIIPVSRRDMEELAGLWDGVSLTRYRLRRSDTRVVVTFRIEAQDPQAFANLWSGVSARADRTEFSPRDRSLVLPITSRRRPVESETADLVGAELRGGTFRMKLSMPGTIRTIRSPEDRRYLLGEGGEGSREVILEADLAELILAPEPYELDIVWD